MEQMNKNRILISIDDALALIAAHYQRPMFSRGTIYNKIYRGDLKRFGPRHKTLLDQSEVIEKLCK